MSNAYAKVGPAPLVAFSKFDPYRPEEGGHDASSDGAHRRSQLLKYGWWISVVYTLVGFGFIAYWMGTG
jgi:hypothetical protein